ncbi:MAG: N-acetylmuramoyl-L-alanine amidase [Richelia sp. RM2_1_2]|nr:N-acetylmuramoyl-L-alanine amidase [Richelia sp. RM2_1_2]
MFKIDKETYKVEERNYYKTEYTKKQIILGGSLRKDNHNIVHLKKKDYGYTTKWPTYTISRSGEIFQHFDPKCYSDHMGIKEIDKKSISINLENMGMVYYDYENNKFLSWTNDICPEENIFEKNWKGNRYWERYTKEQFLATAELCKYLCDEYGVPLECEGHNSHMDNAIIYEGILSKSNFDMDYQDVNPSFDFKKFLQVLNIPLTKDEQIT